MKFVIPQNFNIENKIFGFLDYASCLLLIGFGIILFAILNLFSISFIIKISIFLVLFLPLFILSITGFYKENLINVLFYILKYIFSQKIFLYM